MKKRSNRWSLIPIWCARISGWAVVWWIVAVCYVVLAIVDLAIDACSGEIGLVAVMMQGVFASSMAFGVPICLAIIASESKFLAAERCERLAGDGDGTPSARL